MIGTVEIPLTNGRVAIVDAADAPALLAYSWQCVRRGKVFYAKRGEDGRVVVYMHRQILGVTGAVLVDHRSRDGLDNRRKNLRVANRSKNGANSAIKSTNTSGLKGVHFDKSRGLWRAEITVDGKNIFLGRFASKDAAATTYDEAALKAWGEFALTNSAMEAKS